jgi:simple sugar transport system substrate-binding protein/basic membrane protein A
MLMKRLLCVAAATAIGLTALTACGGGSGSDSGLTVGVVMVGSTQDAGYNEAVSDAAEELKNDGVKVLTADQIPENNNVTQTMQAMVNQGAKVIFATSYGYLPYAQKFAESHPDVTVLHQGGYVTDKFPANFGTYWGQSYDPVSLGGMAAGGVTKSNKLGYIYAFPIAQTIANINAFQLGAQKVNPAARTQVVNTSTWCDPLKQKQSVDALLSQGVDVIANHQDCQSTIIQSVKSAGKYLVGYHFDAKDLAPDSWLTGAAWNWAPVFKNIVDQVEKGTFTGSEYNANWVGSFTAGNNPIELARFGSAVPQALQDRILAAEQDLKKPDASTFVGPIECQDGRVLVPAGKSATYSDVNSFDCLIKGVDGTLPAMS